MRSTLRAVCDITTVALFWSGAKPVNERKAQVPPLCPTTRSPAGGAEDEPAEPDSDSRRQSGLRPLGQDEGLAENSR